jgi:HEAT repeat protein
MRSVVVVLALSFGCTSGAAKQARVLYDKGDFAGAAAFADKELAGHPADDDLWRVRLRAALAQGDARGLAAGYERYRSVRIDDDSDLLIDMATATLGQGLASTSIDIRVQSIGYVEDLELEPLADAVMDLLASDDDRVAAAAAAAVVRGHPQAPYILEELLKSDDPEARAIAVEGVGRKVTRYGGVAADDLRKAAIDPDERVRIAALRALVEAQDDRTTEVLAEALADKRVEVRVAAARSLARRKKGDLAGYAKLALADPVGGMRLSGIELLSAAGDRAGLVALTTDPDPMIAVAAAAALGDNDPLAATKAIDAALASPSASVRAGAINQAAAAVGKDGALTRARAAIADPDLGVRLAAARQLAYLAQPEEAIPVLATGLASAQHKLQAAADLARLEDERGTAVLSSVLLGDSPVDQRRAAAGLHATAREVTPGLVAALADRSGSVRIIAAFQMIKLARKAN